MASGLPVIATNVGANAELVRHGETGAIVAPGDVEALAAVVVRLATNPDAARRMGRAGRAAAVARFSLRAMTDAYQSLYDAQLAARGVPARVVADRR